MYINYDFFYCNLKFNVHNILQNQPINLPWSQHVGVWFDCKPPHILWNFNWWWVVAMPLLTLKGEGKKVLPVFHFLIVFSSVANLHGEKWVCWQVGPIVKFWHHFVNYKMVALLRLHNQIRSVFDICVQLPMPHW